MFPRLDPARFAIQDDVKLILDILDKEKILLVQGSAFNIDDTQHFRLVFLPSADILDKAVRSLANFLQHYP